MPAAAIPLTAVAGRMVRHLARLAAAPAIAAIDGATLLGERAQLCGFRIPGRTSAGGGCQLFDTRDGMVALNLARDADRALLPALFAVDAVADEAAVAAAFRGWRSAAIVARGRDMGLAIADRDERVAPLPAVRESVATGEGRPRVLDLTALWAGPLAAHLLWLAGAEVVRVERPRSAPAHAGEAAFDALLAQGKASVALDLADAADRAALLRLIAAADIVVEAARPRALYQLGIDADRIVAVRPGLTWITITGHGATGDAANWVGFGDDAGVAAGLSAALRAAAGGDGFVGDAIADPLTGIAAATAAWTAWRSGRGGRHDVALAAVAARCLADAHADDPHGLAADLRRWAAAAGEAFPRVATRALTATVAPPGADTARIVRAC